MCAAAVPCAHCAPNDEFGIGAVHHVYRRWFGPSYDLRVLNCALAAAAAEQLGGDPPWLLLVGGSGAAKTETIAPLAGAGAEVVSTINGEAALLSGTSRKDRDKAATGGLLCSIGDRGILVVKDVTSILSMNRDTRALVLAALREIYDGRWSRHVGTDGGLTLKWEGRLVVIGGVTTAWDSAHQVVSTMGDRFLLVRLDSSSAAVRRAAGRQAMRNVDSEPAMRAELSTAVARLLKTVNAATSAEVTAAETETLLDVADLVTQARTAVERDFKGLPLYAHAQEMPTRFAKQLVQIVRGALALGLPRAEAMACALRCAGDSMPPHRLAVLADVADHPMTPTGDVMKRVQMPRPTVDRLLQELQLLGLLTLGEGTYGTGTRWIYTLAPDVNRAALGAVKLSGNVTTPRERKMTGNVTTP